MLEGNVRPLDDFIQKKYEEHTAKRVKHQPPLKWPYDSLTGCLTINPQSACTVLPWLMSSVRDGRSACQFFDISASKKFEVDTDFKFGYCCCLYSRGGWLLLHQPFKWSPWTNLFLFNPISKVKIYVPSCVSNAIGVFSLSDEGTPDRVVFVGYESTGGITAHIWQHGSKEWTMHASGFRAFNRVESVFLCGNRILCFVHDKLVVFNLSGGGSWSRVRVQHQSFKEGLGERFFILGEGGQEEILKVVIWRKGSSLFRFYKLDQAGVAWVKLDGEQLKDRNWFLSPVFSITKEVVGGGSRVFTQTLVDVNGVEKMEVEMHDLVNGSTQSLLPAVPTVHKDFTWVDLKV